MMDKELKDWPKSYYQATDYATRHQRLFQAIETGIEPKNSYRATLLDLRYDKDKDRNDRFLYSWMLLCSYSETPYVFKSAAKKHFLAECNVLMLSEYASLDEEKQSILRQEWRQLASLYLYTCLNSKAYGAYLNLIPMSRDSRAFKLSERIDRVASEYPQSFGLASLCEPLYDIMKEILQALLPEDA